jgi:hypothetical protein
MSDCFWMTGYPDITRQGGGNVQVADHTEVVPSVSFSEVILIVEPW